jgi:hypothetical protein
MFFIAVDLDGIPAADEPQYWHRAAGFAPMFIAHAESKHRVKFETEHAPNANVGVNSRPNNEINTRFVIILSWGNYNKK